MWELLVWMWDHLGLFLTQMPYMDTGAGRWGTTAVCSRSLWWDTDPMELLQGLERRCVSDLLQSSITDLDFLGTDVLLRSSSDPNDPMTREHLWYVWKLWKLWKLRKLREFWELWKFQELWELFKLRKLCFGEDPQIFPFLPSRQHLRLHIHQPRDICSR